MASSATALSPARLTRHLLEVEQAAAALGFRVRYELGSFSGGACVVQHERQIVLNKRLPPAGRLMTLVRALNDGIDDLEAVHLKPSVRALLEADRADRLGGEATGG